MSAAAPAPAEKKKGERTVERTAIAGDGAEASIRPLTLAEFVGQQGVRENLAIFISAARERGEALDH